MQAQEPLHLSIALMLGAAVPCADAWARGPDWDEIGDAGRTPATAQRLFGAGPLQTISGRLQLLAISGEDEDMHDMYLVRLEQPTEITFTASTTTGLGGSADFNTRLWMFDANGVGLLANDDAARGVQQSTLLDASTDGTGVVIAEPGLYFIAVTGLGTEPVAIDDTTLFNLASPTEISGPDGPGGKMPIADWASSGQQGEYVIAFTGVTFFAPGDLDGDGDVNVSDLLSLIGSWGACPDCLIAPCLADLNADCTVNIGDLLTLVTNWG